MANPSTHPESHFVMILFPFGPKPMVNDDNTNDPPLAFYPSADDARTAARGCRACTAYGYEIFRLGDGDE